MMSPGSKRLLRDKAAARLGDGAEPSSASSSFAQGGGHQGQPAAQQQLAAEGMGPPAEGSSWAPSVAGGSTSSAAIARRARAIAEMYRECTFSPQVRGGAGRFLALRPARLRGAAHGHAAAAAHTREHQHRCTTCVRPARPGNPTQSPGRFAALPCPCASRVCQVRGHRLALASHAFT